MKDYKEYRVSCPRDSRDYTERALYGALPDRTEKHLATCDHQDGRELCVQCLTALSKMLNDNPKIHKSGPLDPKLEHTDQPE